MVGGLTITAMFVCLVVLGWRVMVSAPDSFGKLLALGVTLMVGFQAAMNIAVVTVSVPTKGFGSDGDPRNDSSGRVLDDARYTARFLGLGANTNQRQEHKALQN